MTLRRFKFEEKNAAGHVIRRTYRYVDRSGPAEVRKDRAAPTAPAPFPPVPPHEDSELVNTLRQRVADLESRVEVLERTAAPADDHQRALDGLTARLAALEARSDAAPVLPSPASDAASRDEVQELAGIVADGFKRIDDALAALGRRIDPIHDHGRRIATIEHDLGAIAVAMGALSKREGG